MLQAGRDKAVRPSIVITELPYQTNKSDFVATTARLVEEQKLTGEQKTSTWASLLSIIAHDEDRCTPKAREPWA